MAISLLATVAQRRTRTQGTRAGRCGGRALAIAATLLAMAGCGRRTARPPPAAPTPVAVASDTAPSLRLPVVAPAHARVWLARVRPTSATAPEPPLPEPEAPALPDTSAGPPLVISTGLQPPMLRSAGRLDVPRGHRGMVELDLRVDEDGTVTDVQWAAGSRDTALVRAAITCARSMLFYPAQRAGAPVPVWCRQRFDVTAPQ